MRTAPTAFRNGVHIYSAPRPSKISKSEGAILFKLTPAGYAAIFHHRRRWSCRRSTAGLRRRSASAPTASPPGMPTPLSSPRAMHSGAPPATPHGLPAAAADRPPPAPPPPSSLLHHLPLVVPPPMRPFFGPFRRHRLENTATVATRRRRAWPGCHDSCLGHPRPPEGARRPPLASPHLSPSAGEVSLAENDKIRRAHC